jgi:hypothetical protein
VVGVVWQTTCQPELCSHGIQIVAGEIFGLRTFLAVK